jgi:sugar O-acyltransferase (sialic acid O-acetyltransferase NeuD family)
MSGQVRGIFGTGGCGRGILPLARQQYPDCRLVYVDDRPQPPCNGTEVMTFDQFARIEEASIAIAIAAPAVRRKIAARCVDTGLGLFNVMAPDLILMDEVTWQPGSLFSPRVTLTSNIRIGAHFHCNLHSYVEHDCRIGDFVTFGPGVRCNGAVTIGDDAYIGSGAMVRQGITIGAGAVVGMGAVVVKDVPAGATVVGNPARPIGA